MSIQEHHPNNYDISSQLASQCSLHSCNSMDHCHHRNAVENPGYTSSLSNDTLWDPKSEGVSCNRQNNSYTKPRPSSVYHQPTTSNHSYIHHRYVHPSQVQPIQNSITTTHAYIPPQYNTNTSKQQKSWDGNLCNKGGNYASSINNNAYMNYSAPTSNKGHVIISRKSNQNAPNYGRYSAFAEVENYVPAPQGFLQEETITKTTIITTKSTENLINNAQYNDSCECLTAAAPSSTATSVQRSPKPIISSNCAVCNAANFNNNANQSYQGYYSNLTRSNPNRYIPTKTEITRL